MYGDVIQYSDIQRHDTIEANHVQYQVLSIRPARDGYQLSVKRLSDGLVSNQHSLYLGKEIILIRRPEAPARLTPAKTRRYFAVGDLASATPTSIRMTWESYKSAMNGNRQLIDSAYFCDCEACGGPILVGEQCLWTPGHVIHLSDQKCIDHQTAMIDIVTNRQQRKAAHDARRACEKAREFAKVMLGTLAITLALPPGPLPLDYAELWASGD